GLRALRGVEAGEDVRTHLLRLQAPGPALAVAISGASARLHPSTTRSTVSSARRIPSGPPSFRYHSSVVCARPASPPAPIVTAGTPSAIGMLASVEETASSGSAPTARVAASAARTSG